MDPCSQEVLIYDICFRVVFFTALIHTDCVELLEPGYCPLFLEVTFHGKDSVVATLTALFASGA